VHRPVRPDWKVASVFSEKHNYYSVQGEADRPILQVRYPPGINIRTEESNAVSKMQLVIKRGPGGPLNTWFDEEIDLAEVFTKYFPETDEVPKIVGIGLLSDGDGTKSLVEADYAAFELVD